MLMFVVVVWSLHLCGRCAGERDGDGSHLSNAVFLGEDEASTFLGRHLLYNRFDFEVFTPGNLERECREEVCNYEEAREVFENYPDTDAFWREYIKGQDQGPKMDVTALLVGMITGGVFLIIVGFLIWYWCRKRCMKDRFSGFSRTQSRRSNASVIIRRLEEVSLYPLPPPPPFDKDQGLPSYEQAIAAPGPHDAAPPPYPGSRHGTMRRQPDVGGLE